MLRRSPGLRLALPLLLLLACGGGGGLLHGAGACTSYIAGRDATIDGVVIIARNDDGDGATTPSSLVFHPARDGPAVFRANLNNLTIELPAPGLAYFALPDGVALDARNTSGEAAGWNAAGVAVSATESIYNSAAALAAGAPCAGGMAGGAKPHRAPSRMQPFTSFSYQHASLTPPAPCSPPCRPAQRGHRRD